MQSELKLSAAEFAGNEQSMDALTAKGEILNKKLSAQTEKVNETRNALETAKEIYGKNSDKVKDWQIKLNNAEAQLAKMRDEVKKNADAIRELGAQESELEKTANAFDRIRDYSVKAKKKLEDVAESFKNVKGKGDSAYKKLEKVQDALKKIGSMTFKPVVAGITAATVACSALGAGAVTAGKQLYDAASQAATVGDSIDEASQRMKLSAEDYQEITYAAKMSGVELTTLETAAKTLQKSGSNMDLSKAINQVASIKDESTRAKKAIELFGSKAAYSMGPMLAQGADGIKKLKDTASEYNLVLSDKAVAASAVFNDSLDNLTGTISAVKNNLSAEFLPGITDVMQGVTGLFTGDEGAADKIMQGVENIGDSLGTVTPKVASIFSSLATTAAEIAPEVINSLVSGLTGNIGEITDTALEIVQTLGSSLLAEDNLNAIIGAGVDLIVKLGGGLLDSLPVVLDAAFAIADGLISALLEKDNMDKLVDASLDIVVTLGTGLISSIPDLLEAAWELIKALVDALLNYDWSAVGSRIWASIKSKLFGEADDEGKDGNSHAIGLNYVPYDNYSAILHEGEAVLTAAENKAYRAQKSTNAQAERYNNAEIKALRNDVQELTKTIKNGVNINNTREVARELDKRVRV